MATKHEVNRIREGSEGQVILTINGVSTWVDPAQIPVIQAAIDAATQAQTEVDALEGVVGKVKTISDAAAAAATQAQTEVDALENVVTTVKTVSDAAAAAATQAQTEVDALEVIVANIEAMKPIFKTARVSTFTNMTGKTRHLILPTGVNLHSLKVYKDGLLYSETEDYTGLSDANGVSVTGMEAYENTEVLQFEIIVLDMASRTAALAFFGTTNYTGQYPNAVA